MGPQALGPLLPAPNPAPWPWARTPPTYFLELCTSTAWSLWKISGGRKGNSFPPSSEHTRRCRLGAQGLGVATGGAGFRDGLPVSQTDTARGHQEEVWMWGHAAECPGTHQAWLLSTGPAPDTAQPASASLRCRGAWCPQLLGGGQEGWSQPALW